MAVDRRLLMMAWILALAAGLVLTVGLPAAFSLLLDLAWWR
ncbi:MAG TPA: hypothetical protein VK009_23530 [Chloroflexota bacterium]|nr:hypothetical protein [Chloroflexota bacterium]